MLYFLLTVAFLYLTYQRPKFFESCLCGLLFGGFSSLFLGAKGAFIASLIGMSLYYWGRKDDPPKGGGGRGKGPGGHGAGGGNGGGLPRSLDDCFSILGVSPSATPRKVKKAYRDKIKKYHPDRVAGLGEALRKVAEAEAGKINFAYERLRAEGYAE